MSPAAWPGHIPRTPASERRSSPYRASSGHQGGRTWATITAEIQDAVARIGKASETGATLMEISTGHDPRQMRGDGVPLANARSPEDPGVAVVFVIGGERTTIPADRFHDARDNARAIWYYLDHMARSIRDGVGNYQSAFAGFMELPAHVHRAEEPAAVTEIRAKWHAMTGAGVDAKDAYRLLAKQAHPDGGGSEAAFQELTRLKEAA